MLQYNHIKRDTKKWMFNFQLIKALYFWLFKVLGKLNRKNVFFIWSLGLQMNKQNYRAVLEMPTWPLTTSCSLYSIVEYIGDAVILHFEHYLKAVYFINMHCVATVRCCINKYQQDTLVSSGKTLECEVISTYSLQFCCIISFYSTT